MCCEGGDDDGSKDDSDDRTDAMEDLVTVDRS